MANKAIKGITIEIDGNTTKLSDSLKSVNSNIITVQQELREVDKLLKLDPENTELLIQKQKLLSSAITSTSDKLKTLRDAYVQALENDDAQISEEQFRALEREIIATEQSLKKFDNQLNSSNENFNELEKNSSENTKGLNDFADAEDKASKNGLTLGDIIKSNLISEGIITGIKAVGNAMKELGSKMIEVGKSAVESYAEYEQLIGGVETLFEDSSSIVSDYANNAYKTAGLSANEYMETVTSFSAGLLQSLNGDTAKSAEIADMAITDMSDNANKMGTSMETIQTAYQGFAKQNYTMLDNLKLGYGGTKTEMERLLADAEAISGVEYDITNLNDVYSAIHVIQEEMGIAGTTAKEASSTILGSLASTESAWSNLLTGLADDDADISELINNFVDSVITVGDNILPVVETVIEGIVQLIMGLAEKLVEYKSQLLETGMSLLQTIMDGIVSMLPQLLPVVVQIINNLVNFLVQNLPVILQAGITIIVELVKGIAQSLPTLIPAIIDALILMVETLIDNIDMIIDAGIQLIMGLADGLIEALPRLIDKIPEIIDKLITAITNNLPKLIEAGITLVIKLAEGLIKAIPQLVAKIPQIITSLVNGFKNYFSNMKEVGLNLVQGLWEGIKNSFTWIKNKIKEWVGDVLSFIKKLFGINSPAKTTMLDGKYLAQGLGVGIIKEIPKVQSDVEKAMGQLSSSVSTSLNPVINPQANSNPLILQIENFNNNRDTDIQALSEELEFYRKNSALAKGSN